MLSEGNGKMLNQTQFAKACGVSISTIRNRVNKGYIVPAQTVGGKDYFTEDQVIAMQLAVLRGSVTQSFVALICEDDDTAYEKAEADFVGLVKSVCPSAHSIVSLAKSMESMGLVAEFKLTESTIPVFRGKVIDRFLSAVRRMVNDVIANVYLEEPLSRSFTYQFFLDVFTEGDSVKPNETLVSEYCGCGITNTKYLLQTLKSTVFSQFQALKGKYGIYSCCEKSGFTLKDALYADGKVLLTNGVDIIYDTHASGARAVFDSLKKDAKGTLVKGGISTIYQEGFYTSIHINSSASASEVMDVVSTLSTNDYKMVYMPSREKMPETLRLFVEMKLKEGTIRELMG